MTESEVWKGVVGYEGLYQVSDKGNVFSVERIARGRKRGGFTLKPRYDRDGYFRVTLYKNGIKKNKYIHRLVAEAFVPNPKKYLEVNHLDEIKGNNYVENLEWCSARHNTNHGTRNRRISQTKSKKVRAVNVKTGEVLTFNSTKEAGKKGFSQGRVSRACRGFLGDGHTYRGHKWSYQEEIADGTSGR